jgi:hypothetical protein
MSEPPRKITAEFLGTVKINNGQNTAELRRERDPNGSTVVHAARKSRYVHERWHSAGKLDPDLFPAADKFRMNFERAGLMRSYARLDLCKTRAGQQEMGDRVAEAKGRVRNAMSALGRSNDGQNFLQSCLWSVVGQGLTLYVFGLSWFHDLVALPPIKSLKSPSEHSERKEKLVKQVRMSAACSRPQRRP